MSDIILKTRIDTNITKNDLPVSIATIHRYLQNVKKVYKMYEFHFIWAELNGHHKKLNQNINGLLHWYE